MSKVRIYTLTILIVLGLFTCVFGAAETSEDNISWLDNGQIRLGANLDFGGAITYLADAKTKENIINSFDWGRQIQMSFYSGPIPFLPDGEEVNKHWKNLGWNPIQSGDAFNHNSKILEHTNDGKTVYVKCIPMHWPLNNVPGQCTFECWYTLEGRSVKVRSRLNNHRDDKTQYEGRNQEMPAVYTNAPWHKLMTYTGDKPFTHDTLREITKKESKDRWPFPFYATENWAALLKNDNTGLGIWHPGPYIFLGGFHGQPGIGGAKDNPTGYISPVRREILDWNIQYEYDYVLIVDTLENIRKYVYDHTVSTGKPHYTFKTDRQHWVYENAVDQGLPINGMLTITAKGNNPVKLVSPEFFCKTEPTQKLMITAAIETGQKQESVQGRIYWKTLENNTFADEDYSLDKSCLIELPADGKFHTTCINIGEEKQYQGVVMGLKIEPFIDCKKDYRIQLKDLRIE